MLIITTAFKERKGRGVILWRIEIKHKWLHVIVWLLWRCVEYKSIAVILLLWIETKCIVVHCCFLAWDFRSFELKRRL